MILFHSADWSSLGSEVASLPRDPGYSYASRRRLCTPFLDRRDPRSSPPVPPLLFSSSVCFLSLSLSLCLLLPLSASLQRQDRLPSLVRRTQTAESLPSRPLGPGPPSPARARPPPAGEGAPPKEKQRAPEGSPGGRPGGRLRLRGGRAASPSAPPFPRGAPGDELAPLASRAASIS